MANTTLDTPDLGGQSLSPLQVGRECYLQAVGRVLVVEVLGLNMDTIWISFPTADAIAEGTGVELVFQDEQGFTTYHARVAVGPKNTNNGIMLERAETPSHMKKRRDWRVPTDFPVWIRKSTEKEKFKGELQNLTVDGSLIATHAPFEAGDILELTLQMPDNIPQKMSVQIIYSDKTKVGTVNRFGLRFIDLPKNVRECITWYLYEKIQEIYPDQLRDLYPAPARITR